MRRLTAILLALLSFCGCLSKGDAAHHIYVLSFGVESGDTFAYRIVLLAAMPKAGSEEGATLSTEVLAAEARTLFEAIETLNAGLPMTLRELGITEKDKFEEMAQNIDKAFGNAYVVLHKEEQRENA